MILTIIGGLALIIRYVGDYLKNSKELELFGANKDLPEPLKTILKLAQFNQVHQQAQYDIRLTQIETDLNAFRGLIAETRSNCLICPHLDQEAILPRGESPGTDKRDVDGDGRAGKNVPTSRTLRQ